MSVFGLQGSYPTARYPMGTTSRNNNMKNVFGQSMASEGLSSAPAGNNQGTRKRGY